MRGSRAHLRGARSRTSVEAAISQGGAAPSKSRERSARGARGGVSPPSPRSEVGYTRRFRRQPHRERERVGGLDKRARRARRAEPRDDRGDGAVGREEQRLAEHAVPLHLPALREFKLSWREAGLLNQHDDKVDSDQ